MKNDTKHRSLAKGIVWRISSIILLMGITYGFTRNLITVTQVTVVSNIAFLIYYYIHERIWSGIRLPIVRKSLYKMFTYITLSAVFILFPVTFIFTGSSINTIWITSTYSLTKHVLYVANEIGWNKIEWGMKIEE